MTPNTCLRPRAALPLLLCCLSACGPTYTSQGLEAAVRDICRKEYGFDVVCRRVGLTLYASIPSQPLISADFGLDRRTIEHLYDALLTVTRVALSTDAKVDYLVVATQDAGSGVALRLLRHVPDIKWYFYGRISRADFEDRGVLEVGGPSERPEDWHDVTSEEFLVRLAASRLHMKASRGLGALLEEGARGSLKGGILTVRMGRFDGDEEGAEAEERRWIAVEEIGDVLEKYDKAGAVKRVRLEAGPELALLDMSREELFSHRDSLPKKKFWQN